jgi:hypothetical protein
VGGGSPLDKIRAQQAAKAAGGGAPAAPAPAAAPASGAKLSPLEQIRAQQAAKASGGVAPAAAPAPTAAKPEVTHATIAETAPVADPPVTPPKAAIPTTGPDGKPLSKIELIRLQGAAKK